MRFKNILLFVAFVVAFIMLGVKIRSYYAPAQQRSPYQTTQHHDDTIRIAYIGDSWAFGHRFHQCKIKDLLEKELHCPVIVSSYGIGGLTSKEVYYALFELDSLKHFMEKGYDYCFISAGINDTYKKMSTFYYQKSMDCIIHFFLTNHIHPIIQEIPDYNIHKAYNEQTIKKKLIRYFSQLVNGIDLDCKQQFRNSLDILIKEKGYVRKISVIRYKSWNNNYKCDLNNLYLEDQIHLNDKGYCALDSVIAKAIISIHTKALLSTNHIRINH